MSSPDEELREQATWALGNIAGDGAKFRDLVLECGIMNPLLHVLSTSAKTSLLRNATWTLSNLCRGRPAPKLEHVINSQHFFSDTF
jgi:importin subunit alpha-1